MRGAVCFSENDVHGALTRAQTPSDTPEQPAARGAAAEAAGRLCDPASRGAGCVLNRDAGRANTREAVRLAFHTRHSHSCFLLPDARKGLQGSLPSSSAWFSFAPAAAQHLSTVSDWRPVGARPQDSGRGSG